VDKTNKIVFTEYAFQLKFKKQISILLIRRKETKIVINHNSVLSPLTFHNGYSINTLIENLPSEWIIYDSIIQNSHISLVSYCTLISPITVALFSGQIKLNSKYLKDLDYINKIGNIVSCLICITNNLLIL
jgi:hypothetical protein